MINFRFHIVSLTAVFLALAIGIVMGVAVIDQATVANLEDGIDRAEANAQEVRNENSDLRRDLGQWSDFAEQAGDELVEGRLVGVTVVVLSFAGADSDALATLRGTIAASGATVQGVAAFTDRLALDDPADFEALAAVTGTPEPDAARARQQLVDRLATELASGSGPLLAGLAGAGFVDVDGPVNQSSGAGSRFVVFSDENAEPRNADLSVPFTMALAARADARVVAVESDSRAADADDTIERAERERRYFVRALRDAGEARLATVDNAADFRGRVATVLALAALGAGQVGDYGVGPGADRLVPELEP